MPNIKFNYLYRDGGNYKKYGNVIFANATAVDLKTIEHIIKSKLIFGEWLYVEEWHLPDLHFDTWDGELDHSFHEFESLEYTYDPATTPLDLVKIIEGVIQERR